MIITTELKNLNIITFLEIMHNNKVELLDESNKGSYTEEEAEQLNNAWLKLYDEYFEIKNDITAKVYLENRIKVFQLQTKVLGFVKLHDLLVHAQTLEENTEVKLLVIDNLKLIEPRFKVNMFDSIVEICERVKKTIKALDNELNQIKSNQEKKEEKQVFNVYKVIASIEQVLERSINVKDVNVLQFIAYEDTAKDIMKSKEKLNKK